MCGIVGAVANRSVDTVLLNGLKRLEYRGYDSAGIVVIDNQQQLQRKRAEGKVRQLESALIAEPITGKIGIAHTRWATHGKPNEQNAHPLISHNSIALAHNGIIENHEILRKKMLAAGYEFLSETDSEVAAHLIHFYMQSTKSLLSAVQQTVNELEGAFALGIVSQTEPDRLIAVRRGSPLVVGLGTEKGETFFASDYIALSDVASEFIFLEEGDIAEITTTGVKIYDNHGTLVTRKQRKPDVHLDRADKGAFTHYMLKEIYDQPEAIAATIDNRLGKERVLDNAFGANADILSQVESVHIVACGTSYNAGLVAKYWIESFSRLPCHVEVASEYRYRNVVVPKNTLFIGISQSGETADTLAAINFAKKAGYLTTLSICNVAESALVRVSDLVFLTRAGVEVGVASTKAFTTQLVSLLMLAMVLGRKQELSSAREAEIVTQLKKLPEKLKEVLLLSERMKTLATQFVDKSHLIYLGRGVQYPVALEAALKLKEISYIHAEAYPAGELKHGPLALVDKNMPVIAIMSNDELLEKLKSNLHEVKTRGGQLTVFTDSRIQQQDSNDETIIGVPCLETVFDPIIYTIPLQLLAYYVALNKGTDVDQPRNLAKSVTVE